MTAAIGVNPPPISLKFRDPPVAANRSTTGTSLAHVQTRTALPESVVSPQDGFAMQQRSTRRHRSDADCHPIVRYWSANYESYWGPRAEAQGRFGQTRRRCRVARSEQPLYKP